MTTARRPVERAIPNISEYNRLIAAELRAVMARKRITQTTIAREVFGHDKPQWLQSRIAGNVAMTPGDLLAIADFLEEDVVPILAAAKKGLSPSPLGARQATQANITPYVASSRSIRDGSAIGKDHLVLLESA